MQLKKINALMEEYRAWLASPAATVRRHYWEVQHHWQTHWNTEALDLRAAYNQALQSQETRRLWNREAYEPKQRMLDFLALRPDYVRAMFADLFNEQRELIGRVGRFRFGCHQLREEYQLAHPTKRDMGHYHDDGDTMISLYLTFQFPVRYAPYRSDDALALLRVLGAANVPPVGDFERHAKVMRTLHNFLHQDAALLAQHQARLRPGVDYGEPSLLLAFDFAQFAIGQRSSVTI